MIGMVLGSVGAPFWPWHAAQTCAFVAMSSSAKAGTDSSANTAPAMAGRKPLDIHVSLSAPHIRARYYERAKQVPRAQGLDTLCRAPRQTRSVLGTLRRGCCSFPVRR